MNDSYKTVTLHNDSDLWLLVFADTRTLEPLHTFSFTDHELSDRDWSEVHKWIEDDLDGVEWVATGVGPGRSWALDTRGVSMNQEDRSPLPQESLINCVECGTAFKPRNSRSRYCSPRCCREYRKVSKGNYPTPPYVGDYELLPLNLKAMFTPGDPNECWISNKRGPNGYAINTSVKMYKANAYRLIYMMMVGPVPPGWDLDHLCDNGRGGCVNWHHLRPTTHQHNITRTDLTVVGRHSRKTHCPRGHPYDEENTIIWQNQRHCKTCKYARTKRWLERRGDDLRRQRREEYAANRDKILAQKKAWRARRKAEREAS